MFHAMFIYATRSSIKDRVDAYIHLSSSWPKSNLTG